MRTHMPISEDGTLERSIKLEVMRLIIDGLFLIHPSGFGSFAVISIWSVSSQSRQLNISTSMSTRGMIALLWSLANVRMKSSFIWILAMSQHVKQYGDCISFQCMRSFQSLSVFRSTFHNSRGSHGMQRLWLIFRMFLKGMQRRILILLDTSKPMQFIQKQKIFYIKTFLLSLCGTQSQESGNKDSRDLPLVACTMPIPVLESASISALFFQQSKELHHLRISVMSMESSIQPSMLPVWHMVY